MIHRKEKNCIHFRNLSPGCLMTSPGHVGHNDFRAREILFDPFYERDAAEYFSDAGGMDPNGSFEGKAWEKKAYPLSQFPSKLLLEEAPGEKIGTRKNENKREEDIVEVVNH
jgi:hypothetical protein